MIMAEPHKKMFKSKSGFHLSSNSDFIVRCSQAIKFKPKLLEMLRFSLWATANFATIGFIECKSAPQLCCALNADTEGPTMSGA